MPSVEDIWTSYLKQNNPNLIQDLQKEGEMMCASFLERASANIKLENWKAAKRLGQEIGSISWEGLHSGTAWRNVSEAIRGAYAQSQLILGGCEILQKDADLEKCMKHLDMSLLMGPPQYHDIADQLVSLLQDKMDATTMSVVPHSSLPPPTQSSESRKRPRPPSPSSLSSFEKEDSIPRISCPSLHTFLHQYMQPGAPVILTDCIDAWPAMGKLPEYHDRAWSNLEYIKRVAGRRTVPVEVGKGTYLSEGGWGQELMTIAEFVESFILGKEEGSEKKSTGYLAQHELFEQIPTLRKDIIVPDYCALDEDDEGEEGGGAEGQVIINAWFGPGGTISPTHTDPYHNLLAQVVGSKAIRLFPPSQTPAMYPHQGLMNNNSQVDPKAPDLSHFPLFANAKSVECVLKAGELLYIPPLWWHYIESLETSFSVSFWWGKWRLMSKDMWHDSSSICPARQESNEAMQERERSQQRDQHITESNSFAYIVS